MTVVLHIGISKTGSSAIQYGLAKHRESLSVRGLHYAIDDAEALVAGRLIASGNGAALARTLRKGAHSGDVTAADFDAAYVSSSHPISLVSSEGLSAADPERLDRFQRETLEGQDVRIVAFVRDLYGHAISSWMQRIKRHGYTGRFEGFCAKSYGNKQCRALRNYVEVFGAEQISVIHYDSLDESVFRALLRTLDVPSHGMEDPPQINRSLSHAETEVLIACNRAHENVAFLSARISDHMIYKHPDRVTEPVHSPAAARVLRELHQGEVEWVNDTFFGGAQTLRVGESPPPKDIADEPRDDIWTDAIEALSKRLGSLEAQNRRLLPLETTLPPLLEERDALRAEVARLKAQTWVDKLKLDLARRVKRRPPDRSRSED